MRDEWRPPISRSVRPGEWPRFEAALADVNRDLAATLPGREPLILMLSSYEDTALGPSSQLHVRLSDGRGAGNAVHPQGVDDEPEPEDASLILWLVADAAQETVIELLEVWPLCPEHGLGTHPRPAGTTREWSWDEGRESRQMVWWCRGAPEGSPHDVAEIGHLEAALPGRQRRAVQRTRRRERRRHPGR